MFLNENLLEDLYFTQPKDFVSPKNSEKVCKIQKSIYELEQVFWSWNLHLMKQRICSHPK